MLGEKRARDAVSALENDLAWLPLCGPQHEFEDLAAYIPSGSIESLWQDLKRHTDVLVVALPVLDGGLLRRSSKELDALVVVVDPKDRSAAEMARRIRDLNQPVNAAIVAERKDVS